MTKNNIIPFRLRPGKDDDILKALNNIPKRIDRSEVIRAALRAYFNIEVVEYETTSILNLKDLNPDNI